MGYIKHHAIIVTDWDWKRIKKTRQKAIRIWGNIFSKRESLFDSKWETPITKLILSPLNGYYTFFVAPDGSKEGWNDSDLGDKFRNEFMQWCSEKEIQAFEIKYGGDDNKNSIKKNKFINGKSN